MRTVRYLPALVVFAFACGRTKDEPPPPPKKPKVQKYDPYREDRERMVEVNIEPRGVRDERVLEAMRRVPRHELVPEEERPNAYADRPLPIGYTKTISQPYIVAAMTEAARLRPGDKVLEIGTGSGYQAAVLAEMGNDVYTIEIIEELADRARRDLKRIGYDDVHVRAGDGWAGWPDAAPFDAIIVTAAAPYVPTTLVKQLNPGGRMVLPVGTDDQWLQVVTRTRDDDTKIENMFEVRFGPMLGTPQ